MSDLQDAVLRAIVHVLYGDLPDKPIVPGNWRYSYKGHGYGSRDGDGYGISGGYSNKLSQQEEQGK